MRLYYRGGNKVKKYYRSQRLKKSYKNVEFQKGVDINVEQGGIFALLGYNGSGKTT
ncbi:MAG: hypothetical protein AB2392_22690 [Neobacillus sp.]